MWWKRRRSERDFRAEIDAHLALEAHDLETQQGLSPDEARFAARRAFGNVTRARERFYESGRVLWLERTRQHVGYALRTLRRNPGFAVATIATLAIGIGLNTAIFSFFYAFLLRPLPVRDADGLVNVFQQCQRGCMREVRGAYSMVSFPEYQALARRTAALSSAAAYRDYEITSPTSADGIARGQLVSCNYFQTLRVRVVLGRPFRPDECAHPGAGPVVVLEHGTWAAQFGGDSGVVGRTISVNNLPLTVIGVAEPGFGGIFVQSAEMWIPVTMQPTLAHGRDSILVRSNASWLMMVGRLASGVGPERAAAELSAALREVDAADPDRLRRVTVAPGALINFPEARREGRPIAGFLALLSAMVVGLACANVMSLLLARGVARRREIGIRLAVGASRARLIEQLLVESGLIALLAALAGMALVFALPTVVAALSPVEGLHVNAAPDRRVFAYALAVAVVTVMLFGIVPALQATNVDLVSAFKGGMTVGRRHLRPSRLRTAAVGIQVAGSALLLVTAALFVRAAQRAAAVDPGYHTRNVLAVSLNLPELGYDAARALLVYDELRGRLEGTPGVARVALAARLPLLGRSTETVGLETPAGMRREHTVDLNRVSGGYLATMGIALRRGRTFTDAEARAGDERPAVVSPSMATLLWPGREPIGQRFYAGDRWYRVTGIAAEVQHVSLDRAAAPFAYLAEPSPIGMQIIVRTSGAAAPLVAALPRWARAIDPAIVVRTERFEDRLSFVLAPARIAGTVTGALGALALVLAAVGIYGMVSYGVSQRRREVAVRMALGATPRGVVALMMGQGSTAVAAGAVVGLALAAAVSQVLRSFLFGLSPLDPLAYAAMGITLAAAALAAMYLPSRRAATIDPAATLREE